MTTDPHPDDPKPRYCRRRHEVRPPNIGYGNHCLACQKAEYTGVPIASINRPFFITDRADDQQMKANLWYALIMGLATSDQLLEQNWPSSTWINTLTPLVGNR